MDKSTQHHPQDVTVRSFFRGLKFRWTFTLACFMILIAIVGETLIRVSTERLVARQQASACRDRAHTLALAARSTLREVSREEMTRLARRFEFDASVLYIEFFDPSGNVLVSHTERMQDAPPPFGARSGGPMLSEIVDLPRIFTGHDSDPMFVDIVEPVLDGEPHSESRRLKENLLGFVRLGIDLTPAQAEVSAYMNNVRSAGIVVVLMIIPLSFIIVRRVSAPIEDLSQSVGRLAMGDFKARSHVERSDEIGDLARAFNRMADELSSKTQSLLRLNEELEDRVQQRTRQLKELASKDPLTALYNRRHLGEVLTRRFSEAERYGTDLSCLMIDLDNFKHVNDRFGHEMGDHLLVLTAGVIQSELRGADVGARFGGDEFCVLLPHTSAEQAWQVGERIVERFQQEVRSEVSAGGSDFGISVGVAGMQELKLVHADQLMKAADQALYGAKDAGKNRIHLAPQNS